MKVSYRVAIYENSFTSFIHCFNTLSAPPPLEGGWMGPVNMMGYHPNDYIISYGKGILQIQLRSLIS